MADNIFGTRFLATREPGWHGIGTSWTGPKTAVEAAEQSGVGGVVIGTRRMGWLLEDERTFEPLDNRRVIVRYPTEDDPEWRDLGTCGDTYRVLQNRQIAEALDASGITARWPVETMGALDLGSTIFICLDMGGSLLAGETHRRYFVITDTRDGNSSLEGIATHTRVVCQNTLLAAKANGEARVRLHHTRDLEADFHFSLDVMDQIEQEADRVHAALEALHDVPLPDHALPLLWKRVYPDPPKGTTLQRYETARDQGSAKEADHQRYGPRLGQWSADLRRAERMRAAAGDRYAVLCRDFPLHHRTALGGLNVVAELADHTRVRKPGANVIGGRADEKTRAFRWLLRLGETGDAEEADRREAQAVLAGR